MCLYPSQADKGTASASYRPWDYTDFAQRLRTFKPFTWFAKHAALTPLQCARYGWKNSRRDTLACVSCGVVQSFAKTAAASAATTAGAAELPHPAQQLISAHDTYCPWRSPCPASFLRFPAQPAPELLRGISARLASLLPLLRAGTLPAVQSPVQTLKSDAPVAVEPAAAARAAVAAKLLQSDADAAAIAAFGEEALGAAVLLAVCGWRAVSTSAGEFLYCYYY
jgi:C3HC zinc finger-like